MLTGAGRGLSLTERTARKLPSPVARARARRHGPRACRVAVRGRGRRAMGPGRRRAARHRLRARRRASAATSWRPTWDDVAVALQVSAYSLKALADAFVPLMTDGRLDRRARLRRHGGLAGLRLDGRGQGRARVDRALPRPRARAAQASASTWSPPARSGRWRPSRSPASPRFEDVWDERAPLGWDVNDSERRRPRRASPCCPTGSRRPPARWSTSTAATTPSAPNPFAF